MDKVESSRTKEVKKEVCMSLRGWRTQSQCLKSLKSLMRLKEHNIIVHVEYMSVIIVFAFYMNVIMKD